MERSGEGFGMASSVLVQILIGGEEQIGLLNSFVWWHKGGCGITVKVGVA